jgi:phosphoribosylformimino-5-aminoimidazole carboxamide ribotide isomerase
MIILPAVDLIGGKVVRLEQGRFDAVTTYATNPAEALRQFAEAGAEWAHVVDLDGARAGMPVQADLICELARTVPLKLQVAGGYRERGQVARVFDAGVARVVVGSLTVKNPEMVRGWIDEFGPDRITLSLDVRLVDGVPMVATSGWAEDSGQSLYDVAGEFPNARHLLVTDIGRDGMLQGPNFELYDQIAKRLPDAKVQASGGVSSLADLERLRTDGAIIGKALWEGRIALEEALGLARA